MRSAFHKFLPVILSLLLVLTGQSIAVSRGVDMATGQMVLCTGNGPVVVHVDANGQPTAPPHYCPDYALTLLGAVADAQPAQPEAPVLRLPTPIRETGNLVAAPVPDTPARAPPVLV